MNFLELERDLTAYVAEKIGLTVDTDIFRGQIPDSAAYGAAVRITGFPENNDYSQNLVMFQVYGKYATRDEAWSLACKCAGLAPIYGEKTEHHVLAFIQNEGGMNAPVLIEDKGRRAQFVSVNFTAAVLTRSA